VITISNASMRRCAGGSVGVDFWGHGGLRGVFWGSGEGFEENLINWQDKFCKFFTKSVNILEWPAYEEKNHSHRDLGDVNSRFSGRRCALARVISSRLSVNDGNRSWKLVGQALPLAGMAGRNARPTIAVILARARQCAARKKTIPATTTLKMPRKASIRRWSGVA
jgi:hypothetical protein